MTDAGNWLRSGHKFSKALLFSIHRFAEKKNLFHKTAGISSMLIDKWKIKFCWYEIKCDDCGTKLNCCIRSAMGYIVVYDCCTCSVMVTKRQSFRSVIIFIAKYGINNVGWDFISSLDVRQTNKMKMEKKSFNSILSISI